MDDSEVRWSSFELVLRRAAINWRNYWRVDMRGGGDSRDWVRFSGLCWDEALGKVVEFMLKPSSEAQKNGYLVPPGIDKADWHRVHRIAANAGWHIHPGFFLVDGAYRLFRLESEDSTMVEYFDSFAEVEAWVVSVFEAGELE